MFDAPIFTDFLEEAAKKAAKKAAKTSPKEKVASEAKENKDATHRATVNEAHFALTLHKMSKSKSNDSLSYAKEAMKTSSAKLKPAEIREQKGRAKAMAHTYLAYAKQIGYSGNITDVHYTAKTGPGTPTGMDISAADHPADVVVKWSAHKDPKASLWHGISAKSNQGLGGAERIANRGTTHVGQRVGLSGINTHYDDASSAFAKEHGIGHMTVAQRKKHIREKKLKDRADTAGRQAISGVRDSYVAHMGKMSGPKGKKHEEIRTHLLHDYFRVGHAASQQLPYVIVSGHGSKARKGEKQVQPHHFQAKVYNPETTRHAMLIRHASHFSFHPSGGSGVDIHAHGQGYEDGAHVARLQVKSNSQKLASSLKIVGTEGSLRGRGEKTVRDWEPIISKLNTPKSPEQPKPKKPSRRSSELLKKSPRKGRN